MTFWGEEISVCEDGHYIFKQDRFAS